MEQPGGQFELPKFSSTEEELKYLRERVAMQEVRKPDEAAPQKQEALISQTITEYAKESDTKVLETHLQIENPQFEKVLERMESLPHREKMRELYQVLAEKGVLSSLKVVQALNNPHIEDDFHGVLVDYIRTGSLVPGLDKEADLSRLLHMTVFEVTLPFAGMQEGEKTLSFTEIIGEMERFYIGMIPLEFASSGNYGHFSLELALSNFSNEIVFYMAILEPMKDLFVKQLLGAFPTAKIEERPGDYNIFNEFGVSVGSSAEFTSNFVYPINLGDNSDQDPFTTILNSFTKIERDGEGAAIQIIAYPDNDRVVAKIKHALGRITQGVPVDRAINIPLSTGGVITKTFTDFFHTQIKTEKKDGPPDPKAADASNKATALIEEKIKAPLLRANMRIVVSAGTKERAEAIRTSIESAFSQFARPNSNGLKWNRATGGRLAKLLHNFTFRSVDDDETLILSTKELATLYHLPMGVSQKDAPQLKTVKASSAPAPSDLPHEGTVIGINKYRGEAKEIRLTKADRLRHLYTIGQTGTGKSVFLKNLVIQDILAGNGACFIDPHGSDVQDVLAAIPKERVEDVIYFDPSYTARPFALNMLEYDIDHPEQKIFVVNEMLAIFKKLYASSPESMGPAFEQYFRNATMLVMEDPETGNTLLDIPRVLADPAFRNLKLSRCKNPIVIQFWRDIATKTSGESGLQNMIPYITNKFDVFISNDVMRPIIAQEKSSFNFRDIMDSKKILLVNLAKGKLGEMNANLLGLIIIGKFLMAAMSRVDSFGKQLPDFYLYVDEFQNIATPSISAILSEARKYGLSLNLAHQFIGQLPDDIKAAVFGNVGNMAVFRVGADDAQFLESQFAPIFKASDIMKIENRNAYVKILINGKPVPPFNVEMLPPPQGRPEIMDQLKNLSYLKYGRDRKTVDDAILKKYLAPKGEVAAVAIKPAVPVPAASLAAQTPFAQAFANITPPAQVTQPPPPVVVIQPVVPPRMTASAPQPFVVIPEDAEIIAPLSASSQIAPTSPPAQTPVSPLPPPQILQPLPIVEQVPPVLPPVLLPIEPESAAPTRVAPLVLPPEPLMPPATFPSVPSSTPRVDPYRELPDVVDSVFTPPAIISTPVAASVVPPPVAAPIIPAPTAVPIENDPEPFIDVSVYIAPQPSVIEAQTISEPTLVAPTPTSNTPLPDISPAPIRRPDPYREPID